jgi:Magnesium chelatase, subunit ChlI
MLARRLATILPVMSLAEALETTRIHSVAGLTGARTAVVTSRPCRAPHHTISDVGLIGGGQVPRPGEVSRAHHTGFSSWMNSRSSAATSWRCCANPSRRILQPYHFLYRSDVTA